MPLDPHPLVELGRAAFLVACCLGGWWIGGRITAAIRPAVQRWADRL